MKRILLVLILLLGLTSVGSANAGSCLFEGFLNESSSPTIDYCGTSNDATWFGSPTSVSGISKNSGNWGSPADALEFDGSSDYLEIAKTSELNLSASDSWSVSAWYKTSTSASGSIVSNLDGSPLEGWEFEVTTDKAGDGTANTSVLFQIFDDGTKVQLQNNNVAPSSSDSNWHQVVITYGGCGNDTCMEAWFDNSSFSNTKGSTGSFSEIKNTEPILIGARPRAGIESLWEGSIDEVKIYDEELNSSEVSSLYSTNTLGESSDSGSSQLSGSLSVNQTFNTSSINEGDIFEVSSTVSCSGGNCSDESTDLRTELFSLSGKGTQKLGDGGAWTWFNDPRAFRYSGQDDKTYYGFIDSGGDVHIKSYNHETGDIKKSPVLRSFSDPDDHNNPSIIALDDGTLLTAYSNHGNSNIYIRKSSNPEDVSSWESEQIPTTGSITYTNTMQLDNGDIYIFFRDGGSGAGDQFYLKSTDGGDSWTRNRLTDWPGGQNPYQQYVKNGNEIHVTFSQSEDSPAGLSTKVRQDVWYAYFDGSNWKTNQGDVSLPLTKSNSELVYQTPDSPDNRSTWGWDIQVNDQGQPRIAYADELGTGNHIYRQARWTGSSWNIVDITDSEASGLYSTQEYYSPGVYQSYNDPDEVYASTNFTGTLQIQKYDYNGSGFELSENITDGQVDSFRPTTVRNNENRSVNDVIDVLFMRGDYTSFKSWSSDIYGYLSNFSSVENCSSNPVCLESGSNPRVENLTLEDGQSTTYTWELKGNEQGLLPIRTSSEVQGSVNQIDGSDRDSIDIQSPEDTTPPSSSDNWSASGFVDKSEATVELTATDSGGSGVEDIYYRVNGGSYTTVAGSSATVTINNQGNNSLEYYAEDSAGNVEATNTEYVALESNSAPSAALTKNNSDPKTFETIKFNASGSTDSDGSISSYEWELGSNGLYDDATGVTATKEYIDDTSPGENKTVSVRITDNDDFIDEKTISFSIDNRQPSASFTTTTNNLELGVDASGSSDRDGTISELAWDWTNDGNYETVKEDSEKQGQFYNVSVVSTSNGNKYLLNGTQQKNIDLEKGVNHTFNLTSSVQGHPFHISTSSVGGNFKNIVTEGVTVTDGYNGGPHVAETGKLYYKPVAGQSGDLYYQCGIHANMGADISLSKHTFGDQTFTHTYNSEGVYNVKLRVTDNDGAVDTETKTVTVQKPLNFERTVDEFNDSQLYDEGYYDSGVNLADGSFNFVGSNLQTIAADLESNFVTSPIEDKWQVGESITMTFDIQEVIQKPSSSRPNLQFAAILDGRHPQMRVGGYNSTHISVSITPKDNTVEDSVRIYDLGGGEQPSDTTLAITPIDQTASNDITFRYTMQRSDGTTVYNESFTNSYSESLGKTSYIQLVHRGEDIPDVASGKSEYDIDSLSYEPYVQGNVAPQIGLVRFGSGVNSFGPVLNLGERLAVELKGLKDPDGNFKEADIVVKKNGNQIFSTTVTQTGTVPLLDITEIKDAKYTVEGTLTDEKGKTTTFTESFTVQEKKPQINLQAPGDGQTLTFNLNQKNKKNVEFDFQIEDNNNFDGSYSILLNGSSIKTGSFTASEFNNNDELDVQTFADVSPGTYNHTLQVTNSETGNTFVSSGNLGQTTFTVEGAEATPTVNIDSPTDGETIFYNKNDRNDANVTVSGSVDTTFSGNADVLLDGATVAAFDFENGTTSFSESFTAANGSHNVKISLTSDTTGTVYNSSTRTFTVEGVDEVPPEITVTQPDLNADADRVDEAFDYNVSFDSEINGTGEIFLRHNNGSKIGIIQDNLDISPGVRTKPGSFTIPTQFRYVGTYEVVGQVTSNKGNVYDSKNTLFILPETSFRELQPNDTTVNTGGDSNATVTLSGVAEISADGTLQIQVKQPDDSKFNTVTTKQFTGFGKDRTYSVDAKFTDITYPEINGNRSTSKEFKYRVKYKLNDETAKGVNQVYTSDSKSFRFSKEAEGVFARTLKQATNLLSTAVPPVFGLLALGASIFLTARETDSNIAIIVVALTASGILIRLGLFPFVDMITGLPGILVLLGVLLYLANNMGEVIS